jgi:dGTPase
MDSFHPTMAATIAAYGASSRGVRRAHEDTRSPSTRFGARTRVEREEAVDRELTTHATRPVGAGNRAIAEQPDEFVLCFEEDLERIRYSAAFRRLAGKCQVFVSPKNDMLRTRLTHALEVAQVATHVASATGLCVPLAEAIAVGHDCGHGPGGHSAEEAFSPYVPGEFDHAVWGADVVLPPLNLCEETLDGIRNHSWKRPAPKTLEGELVSWADRVAYVVADRQDALRAGILTPETLPALVRAKAGVTAGEQLRFFVNALIRCTAQTGQVGMFDADAEVLDAYRRDNFERVYLRPASVDQAERTIRVLRGLVEHFIDAPGAVPDVASGVCPTPVSGSEQAAFEAVKYVASMTDRYAFAQAQLLLGWNPSDLPRAV